MPTSDRPGTLPFDFGSLLLVAFLLGFANAISHGSYSEPALVIILAALAILGWRFFSRSRPDDRASRVLRLALVALLVLPATAFFDKALIHYAKGPIFVIRGVQIASFLLLLSYVPFLDGKRSEAAHLRHARFALFALLTLTAGLATIRVAPTPIIDVWHIQMRGAEALLAGHNPFTQVTVPDTDPENTMTIPYVYPPTALYFGALGILLGKDVRYAMLLSVLVTGIALRFITRRSPAPLPSLAEDAPALFFWLTPVLCMVLELSWIDPVQVMLISLGMAFHVGKKPAFCAIAFGVAISSKQSMFWLIPLVGWVLRFKLREWLIMLGTAFALVLPFMVLDFRRLKYCNFDFMASLPPRSDALAVASWFTRTFHRPFPGVSGFLLAAASVGFAVTKMRRSPADLARASAFTFLLFFFFNKWAFANYYFLLTSLAALAAAASFHAVDPADGPRG